jgi:hypothetical protein
MWMQIVRAAGIPIIGEAYSKGWDKTIFDANPLGFYESEYRRGIYFATNPSRRTGTYLRSQDVEQVGVKVFIPGLSRTEHAYIGRVVATMRNWREYGPSLERLTNMERENRIKAGKKAPPPLPRMTGWLEWWRENYMLIRDVAIRQYPITMAAYDSVLESPGTVIPRILKWVGTGDIDAAVAAVTPEVRTQQNYERPEDCPEEAAEVFDELYRRVRNAIPIDADFIQRLNEIDTLLQPRLQKEVEEIRIATSRRRFMMAKAAAERKKKLEATGATAAATTSDEEESHSLSETETDLGATVDPPNDFGATHDDAFGDDEA